MKHAVLGLALSCAAIPHSVSAWVTFDEFGLLPEATFGGTGIPNDQVASSFQRSFDLGGGVEETLKIALAATPRFSENPPVTSPGQDGKYFAQTGANIPASDPAQILGARWNFNYFISVERSDGSIGNVADYDIDLFYDFDPAPTPGIGNVAGLGFIDITGGVTAAIALDPMLTAVPVVQGSQNLMFGFLANPATPFVTPPAGVFDPNALGNYQFAIRAARDPFGFAVDAVAIEVQTVPVPAALPLLGLASAVLGFSRRRR